MLKRLSRKTSLVRACALFVLLLAAPAYHTASADSVLDKIAQTGRIAIGHREGELPFSYVAGGKVTGYTIDICLRVIDHLKQELGLPRIDVNYVPVTTASRFILVANGLIDMECGSTTNNAERRKLAEFSYPYFITATRFVSRKADRLSTIADLAGRSVVSTTGTVNVEQLNAVNRARNLNISVILRRSHQESFNMVAAGQASAFVMDDILLASLMASSSAPDEFEISREAFNPPQPYGIVMPPGDLTFKEAVNRAMYALFRSGEIETIYEKWFTKPIPPEGRNLHMPLSAELRAIFEDPQEYLD